MATPPPVVPPNPQPNPAVGPLISGQPTRLPPPPQPMPGGGNGAPGAGPAAPPLPPRISAEEVAPQVFVPQLTFWQQPWVQTVLPLVSSLAVHAAIIIM